VKKLKCARCGRVFKSAGALATHERYSKRCGSREMPAAPATPTASRPTAVKVSRRKDWNLSWTDVEKRQRIMEALPFDWGIERRGGRWRAVPIPGTGMTYSEALIRADERDSLARLFPVRRRVREEVEDEEELVKVMLLLELIK